MGARDRTIAMLAERQYGVFSRHQALAAGVPAHVARHRLDTGAWKIVHRGVYKLAGVPISSESAVMAAVLAVGPDAVASHTTAAALWRLPGATSTDLHVSVADRRRVRLAGIRVHRPARLDRADVTRVGTVPVTAPARTLMDLASVINESTLEETLDDALRRGLVTKRKLQDRVATTAHNGRSGLPVLQRLLTERCGGIPESPLETRFRRLVREAGLPEPVPQYEVRRLDGSLIARVDFAYPFAKLAIEVDGYAFHSSRRSWEADRIREIRLADAGWQVLRVTRTTMKEPDEILGIVGRTLAARSGVAR